MKLKVMTYNIASGRYFGDISKIKQDGSTPVDWSKCTSVIANQNVDICGINEIRQCNDDRENANQPLYISKNANLDNEPSTIAEHISTKDKSTNCSLSTTAIIFEPVS